MTDDLPVVPTIVQQLGALVAAHVQHLHAVQRAQASLAAQLAEISQAVVALSAATGGADAAAPAEAVAAAPSDTAGAADPTILAERAERPEPPAISITPAGGAGDHPDREGAPELDPQAPSATTPPDPLPRALIDLLSLLGPGGRLTPEALRQISSLARTGRLPLEPGQAAEVDTWAAHRQSVPADLDGIAGTIAELGSSDRALLVRLLEAVTGQDPRTGTSLAPLLGRFRLPVPPGVPEQPGPAGPAAPAALGPEPTPTDSAPPVPQQGSARSAALYDRDRAAETYRQTLAVEWKMLKLEQEYAESDSPAEDQAAEWADAADEVPPDLPAGVRQLASWLSEQSERSLSEVRAEAAQLGLVPLDAIRLINEWAEVASAPSGDQPGVLIEVDDRAATVWVEPMLRELLS